MVRSLARDLSREGIEAHVATTDDNGPETLDVPHSVPVAQDGATYWYFPRQTRFYTFSWPLGAWLARHVTEFDVVHIHALFSYATLPAAYFANRGGVPYIVRPLGTLNEWGMTNRRPWLKHLSFELLERRVLRHAAVVHYTSDQERLEAQKLQVRTRAAVVPNAVGAPSTGAGAGQFLARYPHLAGRHIVLFLSRLDAKKGVDLLLPAFAQALRLVPRAALVIAGDGPRELVASLKAQAAALAIDDDVVWAGFLNEEQKQAALSDAELFILPSYSENFGIAAAEAMASGLPVIVSNQTGLHREISNAEAGLVVPCDASAVGEAMLTLLQNPALRRSMGQRGAVLAREKYSTEAVTRQLIGLYNQVVN
jgi:glycosyltransferase involved in cell wall biosynthesis